MVILLKVLVAHLVFDAALVAYIIILTIRNQR